MKRVLLISVADADYFRYMQGMVKSAAKNFPEASLFIELINMDEASADILRQSHPDIQVRITSKKFGSKGEKRCFCASRRASLFAELWNKTTPMIWLDADSIIRRSCKELADLVNSHDIIMRQKRKGHFASGTIGIGTSDICRELTLKYEEYVNADHSWMSDQNNLNRVWKEFRKRIYFVALPHTFCDVWLSDDGAIWAAKAKKKKAAKYVHELNSFLE